ncbi:MAG: DUF6070 family protein [Lachnospiraceae bacterium]|nr:DUF6070 family protein [Lachnospiraceae bacterium]
MKRKFICAFVAALCFLLIGCGGNKHNQPSESDMIIASEHALPIADETLLNLCDEIYEEAKAINDNNEKTSFIVQQLGTAGYTAIDYDNLVNMTCTEPLKDFIQKQEAGENAEVVVVRTFPADNFSILHFQSEQGEVSASLSYFQYLNHQLCPTMAYEFLASNFQQTEDGYLLISGTVYSPESYLLTLSEEQEHIALRIDPLDDTCRQLYKKYISPLSYSRNNVFITEWNDSSFHSLDFYDIFEKFYSEVYSSEFPYTYSEELSSNAEYRVPSEEFEKVVTKHFAISSQELRDNLSYDADTDTYLFQPRSLHEQDYAEIPVPEVVSYQENNDGSLTLTVHAVFPEENTSNLFSHEVTVKETDDSFYYLSNHILAQKELRPWWHGSRRNE